MPSRTLLLLPFLAACDPAAPDSLPLDQLAAVFSGYVWEPLHVLDSQPAHFSDVLFGRASGAIVNTDVGMLAGDPRCSVGLIADDLVVTAHHCSTIHAFSPLIRSSILVAFGRLRWPGLSAHDADDAVRRRLAQLGLPASVASTASALEDLTTWSCTSERRDASNDAHYWHCDPNVVQWTEGGDTLSYDLLPGHVFGRFPVSPGTRDVGDELSIYSTRHRCGQSSEELLRSFGEVVDEDVSCQLGFAGGDCLSTYAAALPGSSGGPVVDADHNLFAVVHGNASGTSTDPCVEEPLNPADANKLSYVSDDVEDVIDDYTELGQPHGGWRGWTSRLGTRVYGTAKNWICPYRTVAAGVVGSTTPTDDVGNFGLVCVPYDAPGGTKLDQAKVLTSGALDVPANAPWGFELWPYLADNTSVWQPNANQREQTLVLCPEDYYMTGMGGFEDGEFSAMGWLDCRNPTTNDVVYRLLGANTTGLIGVPGGSFEWLKCPTGSLVGGMRVDAAFVTETVQFRCYND